MTPDQITAITSVLKLIEMISGWHFGTVVLVIIIGPWVLALVLAYAQGKRFEAVVRMYEDNVGLVKGYQSVAGDLKDVVMMNTRALTRVCDAINQNQFCPMVRLEDQKTRRVIDE